MKYNRIINQFSGGYFILALVFFTKVGRTTTDKVPCKVPSFNPGSATNCVFMMRSHVLPAIHRIPQSFARLQCRPFSSMKDLSPSQQMSAVLQHAIHNEYLCEDKPAALILDLEAFRSRCRELHDAFHQGGLRDDRVRHMYALKALQLPALVQEVNSLSLPMGIEVATSGELSIALHAGCNTDHLVFDSPCKTVKEIENALKNHIYLNVDNFQELDRVDSIIQNQHDLDLDLDVNALRIGIRVNPVLGYGAIKSTSTATHDSKFGINLDENREMLKDRYLKHSPWLNAIHAHIGSQGCPIEMLSEGIAKTVDFVEEVNGVDPAMDRITTIDIGGGLPVNYHGEEHKPTFYDLVEELKRTVPVLFTNRYHICTEFGRSLIQKCGFLVSKVEYTKKTGDKYIATMHCGGNMLLREVYNPKNWRNHRISVFNADGTPKRATNECVEYKWDIVGPLCFSGDRVSVDGLFPFEIQPGDYVVIHDAGGYTLGMYSLYNSRVFPSIYAFDSEKRDQPYMLKELKAQQTNEQVVQFWTS